MRYHGLVTLAFAVWPGSLFAQEMLLPRLLTSPGARPSQANVGEPRDNVHGDSSTGKLSGSAPALLQTESVSPAPAIVGDSDVAKTLEEELRRLREDLKLFEAARDQATRNRKSVDAEAERSSSAQRQDLIDLLTKFATKRATARATAPSSKATTPTAPEEPIESVVPPPEIPNVTESVEASPPEPVVTRGSPVLDKVVDPFALGKVLMKTGDYATAEQAFRKVKVTDENRTMVQYLMATAIRKQSQWKRATEAYRVVADSDHDPVLRDLAKWQIENIRWQQQTEQQLDQMRKQRERGTAATNGVRPEQQKNSRK